MLLGIATTALSDENKKLLMISGICSIVPDPSACIEGAASGSTDKVLVSVLTDCSDTSDPLDCIEGAVSAINSQKKNKQLQVFSNSFSSLTITKRKQLQYALRELGFYSKGIDGVWGSGTGNALLQFASKNNYVDVQPTTIMNEVISRVDVPQSFASAPKAANKQTIKKDECRSIASELLGIPLCVKNPPPIRLPSYDTGGGITSNTRSGCVSDWDCGYNMRCIKKPGYSQCVKLVDDWGLTVRDRGAEPASCMNTSDCPTRYKCDRRLKICVKR